MPNTFNEKLKVVDKKVAAHAKFHQDSQEFRAKFIEKYGEILTTVWEAEYWREDKPWVNDVYGQNQRHLNSLTKTKDGAIITGNLIKLIGAKGKNIRHGDKFGVSKFPPNIARRIYRFYSNENDICFDPCAGHNSRMQLCYEEGRNYIGYMEDV